MNRAMLIGRLTKDPELRYTQSGNAVASFTLAVDRPFKNQQGDREADFIPVVVWRKAAENCANYLTKGSQAGVEGRIQVRSYEAQDGTKRWVTEIVADYVHFLSTKSQSQGQEQAEAPVASAQSGSDDDFPF